MLHASSQTPPCGAIGIPPWRAFNERRCTFLHFQILRLVLTQFPSAAGGGGADRRASRRKLLGDSHNGERRGAPLGDGGFALEESHAIPRGLFGAANLVGENTHG